MIFEARPGPPVIAIQQGNSFRGRIGALCRLVRHLMGVFVMERDLTRPPTDADYTHENTEFWLTCLRF